MSTTSTATPTTRPRTFSPRWWVCDADGRLAVAQLPNPAIGVWLVTVVVGWSGVVDGRDATLLTAVGRGALLAWAADEVLRGASPVRRVLGAVVAALLLVRLVAQLG